jgi:uncharacterized protein YjdB
VVGTQAPINLVLEQSVTSGQNVTGLATWTSANRSVVTVEGGTVTAVGIGTTVITAVYGDLTVSYGVSVVPRT